jgi:large subunit ribosomal protein L30
MARQIRVTQIKSTIGAVPAHKLTMKALGFHHHQQVLVKNDTPQIRGMLHQVRHLVRVEEVR